MLKKVIILFLIISLPNCAEFSAVFRTNPDARPKNIGKNDQTTKNTKKNKSKKKDVVVVDPISEEGFIWPLDRKVTSFFGHRRGRQHDGIDIPAPYGTEVKAAKSGTVIYAGRISSYGRLIVIKHWENFFTAYAHLSKSVVSQGQKVKRGKVVGRVGRSGRARTPHLHFEIRHQTKSIDPLIYLPKRKE